MKVDINKQRTNDKDLRKPFNELFREAMLRKFVGVISAPTVIIVKTWIDFLSEIKLPLAQDTVSENKV